MGITQTVVVKGIPQDLFIHLKLALENRCHTVYANTELLRAVTLDGFISVSAMPPTPSLAVVAKQAEQVRLKVY